MTPACYDVGDSFPERSINQITDLDAARRENLQARRATAAARSVRLYVQQKYPGRPVIGDWVYALLQGSQWTAVKGRSPKTRASWQGPYLVAEIDKHEANVVGESGKRVKFAIGALRVVRTVRGKDGRLLEPDTGSY